MKTTSKGRRPPNIKSHISQQQLPLAQNIKWEIPQQPSIGSSSNMIYKLRGNESDLLWKAQ